jgi:hypothetical protein
VRRPRAAVVAAAISLVGGGAAIAAIPSTTTGQITACVHQSTAAVRIIDAQAGKTCNGTETMLNWSKGWNHKGAWASNVNYVVGDVAVAAGSSYVDKAPSLNKPPASNPALWGTLAQKGATGPAGPQGPAGPAGSIAGRSFMANWGQQELKGGHEMQPEPSGCYTAWYPAESDATAVISLSATVGAGAGAGSKVFLVPTMGPQLGPRTEIPLGQGRWAPTT